MAGWRLANGLLATGWRLAPGWLLHAGRRLVGWLDAGGWLASFKNVSQFFFSLSSRHLYHAILDIQLTCE